MGRKFRFEIMQEQAKARLKKESAVFEDASDDFWAAFCTGGSIVATCLCGRTVFADYDGNDWDVGELETLRRNAAKDPDKYVAFYDDDYVTTTLLGVVRGCKCERAAKYEAFIDTYRTEILTYLRRTMKLRYETAKREFEMTEGLN